MSGRISYFEMSRKLEEFSRKKEVAGSQVYLFIVFENDERGAYTKIDSATFYRYSEI